MGFDVHGMNNDAYFRNNVCYWRPLWGYVCYFSGDILSEEDKTLGQSNSRHHIDEEKTKKLIIRLEDLLKDGQTQRNSRYHSRKARNAPDEICEHCNGTGKQGDENDKHACNRCEGKGTIRPDWTEYPFKTKNVRDFIKFLKKTEGGFIIC